jgi:hypothetical protein
VVVALSNVSSESQSAGEQCERTRHGQDRSAAACRETFGEGGIVWMITQL